MARNVVITAVDGQTGFLIAELLLKEGKFQKSIASTTGITMKPDSPKVKELKALGAKIVEYVPGRERTTVQTLKKTGCDTICLVPPAHEDKYDICVELVNASKKASIQNVLLISSAGADYATEAKQPRLREFIDLESLVLSAKGDPSVPLGHSPCVIQYVN